MLQFEHPLVGGSGGWWEPKPEPVIHWPYAEFLDPMITAEAAFQYCRKSPFVPLTICILTAGAVLGVWRVAFL